MGVSSNRGTPKSSILIGFSIINHPFWGTPIFGNTHIIIIGQNDEWLVLSHSFRDPYEPSIIYISGELLALESCSSTTIVERPPASTTASSQSLPQNSHTTTKKLYSNTSTTGMSMKLVTS